MMQAGSSLLASQRPILRPGSVPFGSVISGYRYTQQQLINFRKAGLLILRELSALIRSRVYRYLAHILPHEKYSPDVPTKRTDMLNRSGKQSAIAAHTIRLSGSAVLTGLKNLFPGLRVYIYGLIDVFSH